MGHSPALAAPHQVFQASSKLACVNPLRTLSCACREIVGISTLEMPRRLDAQPWCLNRYCSFQGWGGEEKGWEGRPNLLLCLQELQSQSFQVPRISSGFIPNSVVVQQLYPLDLLETKSVTVIGPQEVSGGRELLPWGKAGTLLACSGKRGQAALLDFFRKGGMARLTLPLGG